MLLLANFPVVNSSIDNQYLLLFFDTMSDISRESSRKTPPKVPGRAFFPAIIIESPIFNVATLSLL